MDHPIACSLDAPSMAERTRRLGELARRSLLDRQPLPDGERLLFADGPGTEAALRAAIEAEAACCPFLAMTLERRGDRLVLDVTGPPDARPVVAALFA